MSKATVWRIFPFSHISLGCQDLSVYTKAYCIFLWYLLIFLFLYICFAHGKALYYTADASCSKLQALPGGCPLRALDLLAEYASITSVTPEGASVENTTGWR